MISGVDGPTNTFLDSLVEEGTIDHALWSLVVPQLDGTTGQQSPEGEILFGAYDESKIKGDISWLDVTNPYGDFMWNFNVRLSFTSSIVKLTSVLAQMDGIYFGDALVSTSDPLFVDTDCGNIWISVNMYVQLPASPPCSS